VKICAIINSK